MSLLSEIVFTKLIPCLFLF